MKKNLIVFFFLIPAISFAQDVLVRQVDSLVSNGFYVEAKAILNAAAQISIDPNRSMLLKNKVIEVLIVEGKLDEAEQQLTTLPPSDNTFLQAVTLTNKGFISLNKGLTDLALEDLQAGIQKFQDSGNKDTKEAAQCLDNLALALWSSDKLNQAEENELIALQIRQKLFGETSEEVAASLNDLGLIYGQTDPDKALGYYEKALATYEKMHGKFHRKIAIANTNIGRMYSKLELFGDAVNNFENAKKIWDKIYPNGHPSQALVLENLGETYSKMGNRTAALGYFEQANTLLQKLYGKRHPDIAIVLNQIGILKLGDHQYDQAIEYFQNALIANSTRFSDTDFRKNPGVKDNYRAITMLYSLRSKALALESQYFGKTLKLSDLKWALNTLYSCDSLIDDIRHHSTDENDKIALGETASEVYEDGVNIAEAISEVVFHSGKYKEKAFFFAEKSKSAVLQESIANANAISYSGIPQDLINQEKTWKSAIAFYTLKLSQKPLPDEERKWRESLFNANLEYKTFVQKLEKEYPDYYNLKFNQKTIGVSAIQQLINPSSAIVSYFISERTQKIFQFIITQKKFKIVKLSITPEFDRNLKGIRNSLVYNNPGVYQSASWSLSKLLVPRLPGYVKEIIFIPAPKLGSLPLEVLPTENPRHTDFVSAPYLVKKFAVSYEFSASLHAQNKSASDSGDAPNIFLCAPVQFPIADNLPPLPGTENEIAAIAALFGGNSKSVKLNQANESLIKSPELSSYRYLHFATHGIVDETNPELSKIFLQPDGKEDGNLFAGEIFNLNLKADLCVLSACQTGLGKLSKAEGVIGLSRALVYAGAKNLIVSFWSVADESTAELMTDFYKILLQTKAKTFKSALQNAKLDMIKSGKYAAPFYWAPFILIGN